VQYIFNEDISALKNYVGQHAIFIIDNNVWQHHSLMFNGEKVILFDANEANKKQSTINFLIEQLIALEADRTSFLVGIGGGVCTDMVGYVASIYMRGLKFGFVPTTILAMVDAAIGGKNGIDVGLYKNMVGTINQPQFIFYHYNLLQSLSEVEFINGFAEIIKHAAIKDKELFKLLQQHSIADFRNNTALLHEVVYKNVQIKNQVVTTDELEQHERKLLNFGHTIGHAIENLYQLPHGHAISIGMCMEAHISEEINNFYSEEKLALTQLLQQYGLPTHLTIDKEKVWDILLKDKKRAQENMAMVLLRSIGNATVETIPLVQLKDLFNTLF
jgi:3-dehydroquinate synthase